MEENRPLDLKQLLHPLSVDNVHHIFDFLPPNTIKLVSKINYTNRLDCLFSQIKYGSPLEARQAGKALVPQLVFYLLNYECYESNFFDLLLNSLAEIKDLEANVRSRVRALEIGIKIKHYTSHSSVCSVTEDELRYLNQLGNLPGYRGEALLALLPLLSFEKIQDVFTESLNNSENFMSNDMRLIAQGIMPLFVEMNSGRYKKALFHESPDNHFIRVTALIGFARKPPSWFRKYYNEEIIHNAFFKHVDKITANLPLHEIRKSRLYIHLGRIDFSAVTLARYRPVAFLKMGELLEEVILGKNSNLARVLRSESRDIEKFLCTLAESEPENFDNIDLSLSRSNPPKHCLKLWEVLAWQRPQKFHVNMDALLRGNHFQILSILANHRDYTLQDSDLIRIINYCSDEIDVQSSNAFLQNLASGYQKKLTCLLETRYFPKNSRAEFLLFLLLKLFAEQPEAVYRAFF